MRRSGAIVFSSSLGGERSLESNILKNGVFTEMIMQAFNSKAADDNNDGIISTDELRDYVSNAVPEYLEQRKANRSQHPTVDRDNIYQKFGFPLLK